MPSCRVTSRYVTLVLDYSKKAPQCSIIAMAPADDAALDKLGWGRRAIFCVITLNLGGLLLLLSAQLIGPSVYWLQDWTASSSPYALMKVTIN